jgi:ribulose-phosphate 3-epimerase
MISNPNMIEVIPTIIAESNSDLESKIKKIEPYTSRVSIDIMDGAFVPNKTVGVGEISKLKTNLMLDLHLMIAEPESQIDEWLQTKADRIIIHFESKGDLSLILAKIHRQNKRAGLAINPETSISQVENLIPLVDLVQVMTVHPGQYGAPFVDETVSKISDFHGKYPQTPIAVDGGINPETAKKVIVAGATILNVGSYIQNSNNITEAIDSIQNA